MSAMLKVKTLNFILHFFLTQSLAIPQNTTEAGRFIARVKAHLHKDDLEWPKELGYG